MKTSPVIKITLDTCLLYVYTIHVSKPGTTLRIQEAFKEAPESLPFKYTSARRGD